MDTSAVMGVAIRCIANILKNIIVRRRLLLAAASVSFPWSLTYAQVDTTPPPIVSVAVRTNSGLPTFHAVTDPLPYHFDASIETPGVSFRGDIYFGVLPPGRNEIFSWVANGGVQSLTAGLVPIAHGINFSLNSAFSVSSVLGQDVLYTFTGGESPGMYLIFALLVAADADPSNTQNWVGATVVPLVFEP